MTSRLAHYATPNLCQEFIICEQRFSIKKKGLRGGDIATLGGSTSPRTHFAGSDNFKVMFVYLRFLKSQNLSGIIESCDSFLILSYARNL